MKVALLSLFFIIIIALQVPSLVKQKMWRELVAYSVLMVVAMFYSFGLALDMPLPNPARVVEIVFTPVTSMIHKVLS
ncbi:hypothetical protein [Desulfofundulus thermocisternus]|uniref:hypothetical protein n=1 Tax=Desulfofundulus thermocisternus TaxID=42471 RepID=UPI001A098F35|nr:hypothetical protein [Desulfofundulus thermocisternus]MBE3586212.1 hypothetical protein [Thermoanaerobacter sp.]MCS5695237.1 hypothetical protein [Desulfofundulus thermocisternus]